MDLSLASIIAVVFVIGVTLILRRQALLRQRMGALRGEMAKVQRDRLALEIKASDPSGGETARPLADDGERR